MRLRTAIYTALVLGTTFKALAASPPVTSTHGSPVRLSKEERAHVLDGDFSLLFHAADLPASVRSAFAGDHFEMADPGEEFQATDVLSTKHLPWRRLVLAGCTKTRCFVHYEKGGRGRASYLVLFDLDGDSALFRWGAALFKVASDLPTLRSMVRSGDFDDGHAYYW